MMRHLFSIVLMLAAPVIALAIEPAEVAPLLARPIIGGDLALAEVQRYCELRVPQMPPLTTAEAWQAEADRLRREILDRVVFRGQTAAWREAPLSFEWLETIEGGPGYRIRKLRYEALPGLWIPALLYLPESLDGRVPAILNVNGHTGLGKQYPPKQIRCINQAKRGMIALNVEWVGMGQLRSGGYSHARMNQLDLCGTSGLAVFYLSMSRAIDLLLSLEHVAPERIAVTGLSGGGWQTIVISALDPRVALSNPVAGYSSLRTRAYHMKDLGDSEQLPNDLAAIADYTHLTAMLAPRPALLTYNSKDECCFESGYALPPLLDAAGPVYRLFNREAALRSHVNDDPGTHNFEQENRQALYQMLGDFFFPDDTAFDAAELPSEDEIKSEAELAVELPPDNADFQSLAFQLAESLPRTDSIPDATADQAAFAAWQESARARLRSIVVAKEYQVQALPSGEQEAGGVKAIGWRLMMDGDWTVPVVELLAGEPQRTAILVADGGRAATAEDAARLVADGYRVLAVDPFTFGESTISSHAYQFALLVACVGDRPLGIQASQLVAVARWCRAARESGPVTIVARGPRTSLIALTAAALDPDSIGAVQRHESLTSLKEVIQRNWTVNQAPELFCFGLLEAFDIPQLVALAQQ
jgi:dienelactone hydrolase